MTGSVTGDKAVAARPLRFSARDKLVILGVSTGPLIYGCCTSMLMPFLPAEALQRGVSQTLVGLVFSVYAAAQLLASPLADRLIRLLGARWLLQAGLAITLLSTLVFSTLHRLQDGGQFAAACVVVRVVEALGTTASGTASFAIVASRFPERVNLVVAVGETLCAVGLALGPALGGGLYALGGYPLPFYGASLLIAVCMLYNWWALPTAGQPSACPHGTLTIAGRFLSSYESWLNCGVLLVVSMAWTGLDPGLQPYLSATLRLSSAQIGLYFLAASGLYAALGPLFGRWADNHPNTYLQMCGCLVAAAAGVLLVAPVSWLHVMPSRWLFGLAITLRELFLGGAHVPTFDNMLRCCTKSGLSNDIGTQAFVSSVWWAVYSSGNVLGPTLAGLITDQLSFPTTAAALSALTLLSAAPVALHAIRVNRRLHKQLPPYRVIAT